EVVVLKKSLDARDKGDIRYSYTVAIETSDIKKAVKNGGTVWEKPDEDIDSFLKGISFHGARPIVVGAGPCGLFAALTLCKAGAKPIIIERGDCVEERRKKVDIFNETLVLDPESNVQFGEGGAGTFSDGKLNTGINSRYVPAVLKTLVDSGAPEEIIYLNKPHVGTDKLGETVINLRKKIISYGGEILFNTKVEDFLVGDGVLKGVRTDKGDFYSDRTYLCIGHSARDTFYKLYAKGVVMAPKIFSMGVRIEHLQTDIDFAQYGRERGKLPPADYKTAVSLSGGNSLYSFCMCPGGSVVNASSEENALCVNGMSNYARDGKNANSALLINVGEKEYGEGVLAGIELQRKTEALAFAATGSYRIPVQTYGGFLSGKTTDFGRVLPSATSGYLMTDLNSFLPTFITEGLKEGIPLIAKKIRGFDSSDAVLSGVEARSSSPVRILRDEKCCSSLKGLYPLGEGAGYAGGIASAAADGIRGVLSSLR
ncbi:MAG: NAD(P)/FAD-dependent oxidoreductase, partial [Christensenellales bacterium]